MPDEISIRDAEASDLSGIVDIYNHYVANTPITFDTEPFTVATRKPWFEQFGHDGPHRLLTGFVDGVLIGYASSSPFKAKPAYRTSVETTVYLHPDHCGRNLGKRLYIKLLECLIADNTLHRAYGGVTSPNPASEGLHLGLGFQHVASYHEVGYKFGKYWDVRWYEKDIS